MKEMGAYEWYIQGVEGLYREGEEEIAKVSYISYVYVKEKLKGRFRACEEEMKKPRNAWDWDNYISYLRWKGIEV